MVSLIKTYKQKFLKYQIVAVFRYLLCNIETVFKTTYFEYIWIRSNEVDETGAYYTEWSKQEKHQCSILTHIYGI